MPCRTRAASATKSGKYLNPYCLRSYRIRSEQDLPTGASGKSWMAFLSTEEWLQLARLAPRPASLLNGLLALQTWADSRGNREINERPTWASARTSEKKAKWTTLIIIDSQAVKNTCNASVKSKGFCKYKATNGIKRHLAVDTLGFPFFSHCTKASVSDDRGLIEMLSNNIDYFKFKPVNIPKITILVDNGYHPKKLEEELKTVYPQIMNKIRFKLSPKPSPQQKQQSGKTGFVPVQTRWGTRKD